MEEKEHLIAVLKEAKEALEKDDVLKLQNLSDQTIHSASTEQHTDYILIAVLIYSLSKISSKRDTLKISNWHIILNKINKQIDQTIIAVEKNDPIHLGKSLRRIKEILTGHSLAIEGIAMDVLRKASINKASKIYEHGISLSQTAKLLGITKWELSEYIGQKENPETKYGNTISIKRRAEEALKFFS